MRVVEDDEIVASLCDSGIELEISASWACKWRLNDMSTACSCEQIFTHNPWHNGKALVVSEKLYDAIENGRLVASWLHGHDWPSLIMP